MNDNTASLVSRTEAVVRTANSVEAVWIGEPTTTIERILRINELVRFHAALIEGVGLEPQWVPPNLRPKGDCTLFEVGENQTLVWDSSGHVTSHVLTAPDDSWLNCLATQLSASTAHGRAIREQVISVDALYPPALAPASPTELKAMAHYHSQVLSMAYRERILEPEDGEHRLDALLAAEAKEGISDPEWSEQDAANGGAPMSELIDWSTGQLHGSMP